MKQAQRVIAKRITLTIVDLCVMSEISIDLSWFNELHFTPFLGQREVCYDRSQVKAEDRGIIQA